MTHGRRKRLREKQMKKKKRKPAVYPHRQLRDTIAAALKQLGYEPRDYDDGSSNSSSFNIKYMGEELCIDVIEAASHF